MRLLEHLLKEKFGLNSSLTLRQQENRLKSKLFSEAQQNSLDFIHRSVVIPLEGSESVSMLSVIPHDILHKSLRPYLVWNTDKCRQLSEQLLSNIVSSTQDDSKDDHDVEENQGNSIDAQGNESLKGNSSGR